MTGHIVKRRRLIFLTQWFDPEPAFKGLNFAKSLQALGWDVEVVTGFPNYPGGQLYPGHKVQLYKREITDGVLVTRLPLYPSHNQSVPKRALNYLSFFLSVTVYLTFFAQKADAAYVYHPPLTVGLAAVSARLFRRTPTLIDIQDLWPDTLRATGMINNLLLLNFIGGLCNWVYRRVDHIAVLSPGFRRVLMARGVPQERITLIYNWADETVLQSSPDNHVPPAMVQDGKFRILFAGNMGKAQGLDAVLEAAKHVNAEAPTVEFCFMGDGIERAHLKSRASRAGMTNVRFLPKVPLVQSGLFLAAADALLVHLIKDPLYEITIPSKTQAYMAAGRPIIMAVPGDAADLISRSGGGVLAKSGDPASLAAAIIRLVNMSNSERARMAEANRDFYVKELSMSKGVEAFAGVLARLASVVG
jgi:colanic acid biosynthesis glycosyl transferase WcaI